MLGRVYAPRLVLAVVAALLGAGVVVAAPAAAVGEPLTGLRLLNTVVDVSDGDSAVGVQLTGPDRRALSDSYFSATCTSCPATAPTVSGYVRVAAATSTGAVAVASMDVAQRDPEGTWQVDQVFVYDPAADNYVAYDDAALTGAGFRAADRTFTVTHAVSGAAPTSPRVSFSQGTVDVTTADAEVLVEVDVLDAVPGVASVEVTLASSGSPWDRSVFLDVDFDLVQGSPRHGTLRVNEYVGHFDTGTWEVTGVTLTDRYGAVTTLTVPPAGGSWGSLEVTAADDTVAPTLVGNPTLAPATVDATSQGATASISFRAQDDVSGFNRAGLTLVNAADPNESLYASVSRYKRVSGTPLDGTYVAEVEIPARQVAGTYTLSEVFLVDQQSNYGNVPVTPVSLTVVADDDSSAPALSALSVTPSTVNVVGGRAGATVYATITDDASGPGDGFGESTYTVTGPGGVAYTRTFGRAFRVSGDARSGTYALPINVWETGAYTLTGMTLEDLVGGPGHTTTLDTADLTAANGGVAPRVTGVDEPDDADPSVTSLTVSPSTFVSGPEGQGIALRVEAADAGSPGLTPSGIDYIRVEYTSPNGLTIIDSLIGCPPGYEEYGCFGELHSDQDGTFVGSLWLRQFAQAGTWTLSEVSVFDNAGNWASVDLAALSGTKSFTVTGTGDTTPPTFSDLAFAPTPVRAGDGDVSAVDISARSTDDLSGLSYATVDLVSPSGRQYSYGYLEPKGVWEPRDLDADWAGAAQMPRYAESGSWEVSVYLSDNAGNQLDLTGAELTGLGMPGTLAVDGVADSAAPTLTTLEVSDTAVDARTQDRFVMFTLRAADAVSGVSDIEVDMGDDVYDEVYIERVGGTGKDGWYAGIWPVAQDATPGNRAITVRLTDERGNTRTVSAADLAGASLPSAIAVQSLGVQSPDGVIRGAVSGPTGAVAGAYVQACNQDFRCGDAETDGTGAYTITGLRGGDYDVDVYPPSGLNRGSGSVGDLYAQPNHTATVDVTLTVPAPLPAGTSVAGQTSGVPSVIYNQPFPLSTQGCAGGSATYTVTQGGRVLATGSLAEGPAGTYTATVPALGSPGTSTMSIALDCPVGVPDTTVSFSLYIDPSGFVYDQTGATVPGAQVTLYRADSENGPFVQVPDGSRIMDPSNRANPDVTDSTGHYGWLTIRGWYRVDVTKAGCYQPGSFDPVTGASDPVTESRVVPVPPEVTDLHVTIDCTVRTVTPPVVTPPVVTPPVVPPPVVTPPVVPPPAPPAAPKDTTAPTATMAGPGSTTTLGASTAPAWSGTDNVGVASYDVRYRTAAWNKALGGYVYPAAWQGTAAKSAAQPVAAGAQYCFSVRARDAAGNVSGWSAERCTAKPLDDRSLLAKGAWAKTKGKAYYGGTLATSKAKNATLTRAGALPGRVALVASKGKGYGTVGVYYNGKLVKKVNLAAPKATNKAVIPLPKLTKKGTIVLKVLTPGKGVPIDGLLTSRG